MRAQAQNSVNGLQFVTSGVVHPAVTTCARWSHRLSNRRRILLVPWPLQVLGSLGCKRRRGRLVFVGAGTTCLAAGAATFVSAKEAVHGFVRALAADLATDPQGRGVEATMLQPDFAARMGDAEIASTAAALLAALGPAAPGVLSPAGS